MVTKVVVAQLSPLYVNVQGAVPVNEMLSVALPLQRVWDAPHVAVGPGLTDTVMLSGDALFGAHGEVAPSALK